jgi:hypothetical protein
MVFSEGKRSAKRRSPQGDEAIARVGRNLRHTPYREQVAVVALATERG